MGLSSSPSGKYTSLDQDFSPRVADALRAVAQGGVTVDAFREMVGGNTLMQQLFEDGLVRQFGHGGGQMRVVLTEDFYNKYE